MTVHCRFLVLLCLLSTATIFAQDQPAASARDSAPEKPAKVEAKSASSNYVLAANDIILVRVYGEPDLDSQHRISKDGSITFPLIGSVKLAGRTVDGASTVIREALGKDYLVNPQVAITVMDYSKRRYTVLGQVQRPGSYIIPEEETIDLLEAIANAGGYTRIANPGNIVIKRRVNGKEEIIKVNAKALVKGSTGFEVMAEDTINVGESLF
ncbi:MAG: polysaccharide biosynthesis/export family protein [Rouxiella badensis]|uniref:polysaccharide biosynthesis/export family protein n=1 Tax=Rouxiella badensis TaxID=1646377 RepID=UPI003C4C5D09